ncbi:hypothetical protein EXIGLDRAFT_61652 [Exidia glandulosa HHB12029]|uniref:F-box domain-containing protein n=1 Tax=Exidia glandulosa HHB12029 TaxID=1314781 RepID=A0A165I482_EXIGL|nr:hypothetical protein EXIGLDRAFT_61652 [Exidia glandulosa HHB12029]
MVFAMDTLSTAARALRILLPDILDHLTPLFPHALDDTFDWDLVDYGHLRSCALVCRDWTGPAQIALFRTAVVIKTSWALLDNPSLPGVEADLDAFISTVEAHPELGAAVRSLAVVCTTELLPRVQQVLSLCFNVRRLNLTFGTFEHSRAENLASLDVHPSVHALGVNFHLLDVDLRLIFSKFPSLESLHQVNLADLRFRPELLPSSSTLKLKEISSFYWDRPWPPYFAQTCVDPGVQYLRLFHLRNSKDFTMFKHSLLELSVAEFDLSQAGANRIAQCTSLRRLSLYRAPLLPRSWPPKLEVLEVSSELFYRTTLKDVRRLLRQASMLRRLVIHHERGGSPTSNIDNYTLRKLKAVLAATGVETVIHEEVWLSSRSVRALIQRRSLRAISSGDTDCRLRGRRIPCTDSSVCTI